jgi:hypothetical protein
MEQNDPVVAVKPAHWARLLGGRLLQRVCPYTKECQEKSCQFRSYCQCACDEERASTILENRLWGIVAACAVTMILYWLLAS